MSDSVIFTSVENGLDGTVIKKKTITRKVVNSQQFVRVFLDDLGHVINCNPSEKDIIIACLKWVDYGTNEIGLTASRRKEICSITNNKISTVNIGIGKLIKKRIFVRDEGKLILNPNIFFYGDDINRLSMLEFSFKYDFRQEDVLANAGAESFFSESSKKKKKKYGSSLNEIGRKLNKDKNEG